MARHLALKDLNEIVPFCDYKHIAPPHKKYHYFEHSQFHPFQYDTFRFKMVNAWWLMEAALLAFAEKEFAVPRFQQAGLPEVTLFNGVTTSTQCYVAHNDNFVIVAFRGTQVRGSRKGFRHVFLDLVTDAQCQLIDVGKAGMVHGGFKVALDEIWPRLEKHLLKVRQRGRRERSVWFTGHSLGGALATLAASRFPAINGLYTFGSPRAGNQDFKASFPYHINAVRFVNNNDIVTQVPLVGLLGGYYRHVGELKYIDKDGRIHENPSYEKILEDRFLGRCAHMINILGNILRGYVGEIPDDGLVDHAPIYYAVHIWNSYIKGLQQSLAYLLA